MDCLKELYMGGMSGGEGGFIDEETLGNILEINRGSALRIAAEKRDRITSVFRRVKVFERTFGQELQLANEDMGVAKFAVEALAPEGYDDPYAWVYQSQAGGFGAEM